MQRINITLPDELIRDFKRSVPNGKRSKFISEALSKKLALKKKNRNLKKELIKSLKANKEFYKQVAEDWKYVDAEAFERIP